MIKTAIEKLLPPEDHGNDITPEERRWRQQWWWNWKMFIALLLIFGVGSFHLLAEKGYIEGVSGVAYAQVVETRLAAVRREFREEMRELQEDLETFYSELRAIKSGQDLQLRLQLAAEICRVHRQRLSESGRTRERLDDRYNEAQERYRSVNQGQSFLLADCGEP